MPFCVMFPLFALVLFSSSSLPRLAHMTNCISGALSERNAVRVVQNRGVKRASSSFAPGLQKCGSSRKLVIVVDVTILVLGALVLLFVLF